MRWNTETFRIEVEKNEGYKLLSEYTKTHEKVKILHTECNNEYLVTPTNFLGGSRCPICFRNKHNKEIANKPRNRARTTESFRKEIYDLVGDEYTLVSDFESTNTYVTLLHNICNESYDVKPYNFLNGKRCPVCSRKKSAIKRSSNIKDMKSKIESILGDDYEVLTKQDYVNNETKIKVYHSVCGELFESTPINLLNGKGCPKCNKSVKYDNDSFSKALNGEYTLLSDYVNNKTKVKIRHNQCNYEWEVRPVDILHPYTRGEKSSFNRCPKCNAKLLKSSGEEEVYNYIKSLGIDNIVRNDRKILKGKELDLYLPDYNFAIEFDGLYWHSDEFIEDTYHNEKTNNCLNEGIQLIHIFEDEWLNKTDIVKSKLKHLLGLNDGKRVYARKCYISEIESKDKNRFLEENHIQGKDTSQINLGLWYEDEDLNADVLVAVMTFCKPRLALGQKNNKTNIDYELSRFATQNGYIVIGGFSKLFSYFKKNYEWEKLITYADRRLSKGNMYEVNGFTLDHISRPSYSYIDKNSVKRFNRFKFRKQEIKRLFPDIYDDSKTEREMMLSLGYHRIFDCGNYVFYYTK